MKRLIIGLFLGVFLFPSCKNEIDLYAPYKEIFVIYSLLDANDTAHYVKVNKAFTAQNISTYEVAQNPDSIFFDSLQVTLYDLSDGSAISFQKDNSIPKEDGVFNSAYNYLYKSNASLNATHRYRLEVFNPLTGNKAISETKLVGNVLKMAPLPGTLDATFLSRVDDTYIITFETGANAYIYDVSIRMIYSETNVGTGITETKTVSYKVSSSTKVESNKFTLRIGCKGYYEFLARTLPIDANLDRKATRLEVEVYGGEETISTYQQANTPSIGVTQKKTDYTNITNGYGLFSSRNKYIVSSTAPLTNLNTGLKTSAITGKLRFQ